MGTVRGWCHAHALPAHLRPQAPPPLALCLELGGWRWPAYGSAHPPSRNREAPILVALNGARVLPICSLKTRRERRPWSLPRARLWASDRDPCPGQRLHLSLPPRVRPNDCSLYSFDFGLGRVCFPFSHFLRANRPLGSSFSAPQFPVSLPRPPSCGQPFPPLDPSPLRVCPGAPWAPIPRCSGQPPCCSPGCLALQLRERPGRSDCSSDPRLGTSADLGGGHAAALPDVFQFFPRPSLTRGHWGSALLLAVTLIGLQSWLHKPWLQAAGPCLGQSRKEEGDLKAARTDFSLLLQLALNG